MKKYTDNLKRDKFLKQEFLKKIYKVLVITLLNQKIHVKKTFLLLKLAQLQKKISKISKIQLKNRCILSNRNKGILSKYSISRIKMLELLRFGIVCGYKKAVW